jgi:hypothetical protein
VRVGRGETLYTVAQRHHVSLLELQRLNRIDDVRETPPPLHDSRLAARESSRERWQREEKHVEG